MKNDTLELLKFAALTVIVIVGWFALASASRNPILEFVLGWIGLAAVVLYWVWLKRNKLQRPN